MAQERTRRKHPLGDKGSGRNGSKGVLREAAREARRRSGESEVVRCFKEGVVSWVTWCKCDGCS